MLLRSILFTVALVLGSCLAAYTAERPPAKPKHASASPAQPTAGSAAQTVRFEQDVAPVLARYCGSCHGDRQQMGSVNLAKYRDEASVVKDRIVWEKVSHVLQAHAMPPKGLPQPTPQERERIATWIDVRLSAAVCDLKEPGRVTLRRLNRNEYNNTIRDLVGVNLRPADDFPNDDVGYGFDNIGDVLTISPLLLEKYLTAAGKVIEKAVVTDDPPGPATRFEAEKLTAKGSNAVVAGTFRGLFSEGEVATEFAAAKDGEYLLRARAYGTQGGDRPTQMAFRLDDKDVRAVEVSAPQRAPKLYRVRLKVPAGKHNFAIALVVDPPMGGDGDRRSRGRGGRSVVLDYLEVVGPLDAKAQKLPESHRRIFVCQPTPETRQECARKIIGEFARRAFRRPVSSDELARLTRYVDLAEKEGDSFEQGIALALQACLVSPHFLFRVEVDRPGTEPGKAQFVGDYEIASRLSYFLWSTMPDEELFGLAASGQLRKPEVLAAQARRMLKDARAQAVVDNFASQWLTLRNLKNVSPDPARFPTFNDQLRADMQKETELFFGAIMKEDRSVLELLDAPYTFLNERLAKHYGIPGVKGEQFRKIAFTGDMLKQRGGVLSQASILTITSNPTRTSPVKRGKWVLEQILGTPPPPPPPDVPELKADGTMLSGTLRQQMEQHRKDPGCASCHARMDPIGFGLENYDPVGAWRAKEGKYPIDSSGTLPDGASFSGPAELKAIMKRQKNLFVKNLAQQLLTYSLGRGLEQYDRCAVDEIAAAAAKDRYRFSTLVTEIVKSEPFRMRKVEGAN